MHMPHSPPAAAVRRLVLTDHRAGVHSHFSLTRAHSGAPVSTPHTQPPRRAHALGVGMDGHGHFVRGITCNPEQNGVAMKHSTKTPPTRVAKAAPRTPDRDREDRDRDLLETLALRVKVLTVGQIARTWWSDERAAVTQCRKHLRQLAGRGLVEVFTMMAHPETDLAEPLAAWQPGLDSPDFGSVSYRAKRRWKDASRRTDLVIVTEQGASPHGGPAGRRLRVSEATHDVHLAAVYLRMRRELPTRARSWLSEAALAAGALGERPPASGEKQPDAMVRDGRSRTAIEFVGDYSPAKLTAFHEHCARRGWGYELW